MKTITDIISSIIGENPFLQFGFSHKLFNLSQLAKFLQPLVEVRAKKEVTLSALTMSLSRLQRRRLKVAPEIQKFRVENIQIFSNLCTFTFVKTPQIHEKIHALYTHIQGQNGYMTLSEGNNEITLITEETYQQKVKEVVTENPKYSNEDVACVGVRFSEKYIDVPGFLYAVLQQVNLQRINIVELASTYTEFILYIHTKDTKLAFETLFRCFGTK